MLRRRFLNLLPAPAVTSQPRRPNVLVIVADDLGWRGLGFQGSEIRTPNLDRFASQSLRLERAYSWPLSTPSRSAFMTGRSPIRLGAGYASIRPWSDFGVSTSERFLSREFRDAGYQTAMAGKWHLGHTRRKYLPNARGFEHSYGHLTGAIDYYRHEREGGLDWHRDGKSLREEGYATTLIGNEACRLIRRRDRRPFFLYVAFNAPHTPLQAPRECLDKYPKIQDSKRKTYAAMVTAMDRSVGDILRTLDDERIAGETCVLFFSANGGPVAQGACNAPLRGGKATCFEGGIRVPAVIRFPGRLRPGAVSRQTLCAMDWFPTLLTASGISASRPGPLDGVNLWPALAAGREVPREEIFFSVQARGADQFAILHRQWKFVQILPRDGAPQTMLFDREQDPGETEDLSEMYPRMVNSLGERVERWKRYHPADGLRNTGRPAGWKAPRRWAEAAS